jgi:hypothetical protein
MVGGLKLNTKIILQQKLFKYMLLWADKFLCPNIITHVQ